MFHDGKWTSANALTRVATTPAPLSMELSGLGSLKLRPTASILRGMNSGVMTSFDPGRGSSGQSASSGDSVTGPSRSDSAPRPTPLASRRTLLPALSEEDVS